MNKYLKYIRMTLKPRKICSTLFLIKAIKSWCNFSPIRSAEIQNVVKYSIGNGIGKQILTYVWMHIHIEVKKQEGINKHMQKA